MARRRLFAAGAPALLGLALVAAGCGGGGSPGGRVAQLGTTTSRSRPGRGSTHDQAVAYTGCMHAHGVPLWPDPDSNGAFDKSKLTPRRLGVDNSQIGSAEKACRSLLPTYSATQQSSVLAQALRFSRCMRAHRATDFPDPESNGAIVIPHAMETTPTYLTALNFCLRKYGVPPPPTAAG